MMKESRIFAKLTTARNTGYMLAQAIGAKEISFWKKQSAENLKRALRAEAMLAQYEGPIG